MQWFEIRFVILVASTACFPFLYILYKVFGIGKSLYGYALTGIFYGLFGAVIFFAVTALFFAVVTLVRWIRHCCKLS